MRVLVAVGSRHGSTREIGERIAEMLREHDLQVEVDSMLNIQDLSRFDAVVIGSAVYMGKWITAARSFLERFGHDLASVPTWIFSSGPVGSPPFPMDVPASHEEAVEITAAESERVFAGKLDVEAINLAERLIVSVIRVPTGDFRQWDEIDAWAREIGQTLVAALPGRKVSG